MQPVPVSPDSQRIRYLDALRGLAAVLVLSTHFLAAFLPYAVFGEALPSQKHGAGEWLLLLVPFSLLTAGHFAVSFFFVLSGFVLAWRFVGQPAAWPRLITAILKRPIRLGGLVLLSIGLGGLLWRFDLLHNHPAATLAGSEAWLGQFWPGQFNATAFINSLLHLKAGSEYNPPLWTIRIELIGSIIVFAALLVMNPLPFAVRVLVQVAAIIWLFGNYYQGFFIGLLLAELHRFHGEVDWLRRVRRHAGSRLLRGLVAVLGLVLVAWPFYAWPIVALPSLAGWLPALSVDTWHFAMAGATLILAVVLLSPVLQRLLNRPWLLWLGAQSFALYVLHFLVLGSLSCALALALAPGIGYLPAVAVSGLASVVVLMLLAAAITRWVDRPTIRLANALERRVLMLAMPRYRRQTL